MPEAALALAPLLYSPPALAPISPGATPSSQHDPPPDLS